MPPFSWLVKYLLLTTDLFLDRATFFVEPPTEIKIQFCRNICYKYRNNQDLFVLGWKRRLQKFQLLISKLLKLTVLHIQVGEVIGSKLSIWAELKIHLLIWTWIFYWLWLVLKTLNMSNTLPAAKKLKTYSWCCKI